MQVAAGRVSTLTLAQCPKALGPEMLIHDTVLFAECYWIDCASTYLADQYHVFQISVHEIFH